MFWVFKRTTADTQKVSLLAGNSHFMTLYGGDSSNWTVKAIVCVNKFRRHKNISLWWAPTLFAPKHANPCELVGNTCWRLVACTCSTGEPFCRRRHPSHNDTSKKAEGDMSRMDMRKLLFMEITKQQNDTSMYRWPINRKLIDLWYREVLQ